MVNKMNKVKIETIDFSGKQKIKAPFSRRFWFFVSFGKYGENHHYKHVMMRKYFAAFDARIDNKHTVKNGRLFMKKPAFFGGGPINCRCSYLIKNNKEIHF